MSDRTGMLPLVAAGVLAGAIWASAFVGCSHSPSPAAPGLVANRPAPPPPPPPPPPGTDAGQAVDVARLPQTLPGAETGIPAWVGQEKDEPFDVKQYLESRAAPAENAAPLYFAALADISDVLYPPEALPGWPWEKKKMPAAVSDLANGIGDLSDPEKLLSGSVPLAQVEKVINDARPAMKKFDEAQQRPRCVFVTGLRIDSLLMHAQASRQLARLACIQLYYARQKGDFSEAEAAVRRTLRLARDLRPQGGTVVQMVSCTIDGVVLAGIADYTLRQPGLDAAACDRLLAQLSEHERQGVSCADEGIRAEYVTLRNTLDAMQTGRMPAKLVAELFSAFGGRPLEPADAQRLLSQVNWQTEIATCNSWFAEALGAASIPYDRVKTKHWEEFATPKKLTAIMLPAPDALFECVARNRTTLAATECLVAVRRYALAHGSLPADLTAATKEAGLKAVPTDPYSGQPMRYKVIHGKPVVYSVGWDRKDDGGVVDWDNGKQDGDFIFRIRE